MAEYIMLVNFTNQGYRGVREAPGRQEASRETARKFGVERKAVWMKSSRCCTRLRSREET